MFKFKFPLLELKALDCTVCILEKILVTAFILDEKYFITKWIDIFFGSKFISKNKNHQFVLECAM